MKQIQKILKKKIRARGKMVQVQKLKKMQKKMQKVALLVRQMIPILIPVRIRTVVRQVVTVMK